MIILDIISLLIYCTVLMQIHNLTDLSEDTRLIMMFIVSVLAYYIPKYREGKENRRNEKKDNNENF